MKNTMFALLIAPLMMCGFSQKPKPFEYTGRMTPAVKKETLRNAQYIKEIMPEFSRYFSLPFKDMEILKERKQLDYPLDYFHPDDNYNNLMEYVSVEISANCNGKDLSAESTSDRLTAQQKNIINAAGLGSEISIRIRFRYKNSRNEATDAKDIVGRYMVTVVPETEAEYPGGLKEVATYLTESVLLKFPGEKTVESVSAAVVRFTINEEGRVTNAWLYRNSREFRVDKALLDAANSMQGWKPAKNAKGMHVKQEFTISLGAGGC